MQVRASWKELSYTSLSKCHPVKQQPAMWKPIYTPACYAAANRYASLFTWQHVCAAACPHTACQAACHTVACPHASLVICQPVHMSACLYCSLSIWWHVCTAACVSPQLRNLNRHRLVEWQQVRKASRTTPISPVPTHSQPLERFVDPHRFGIGMCRVHHSKIHESMDSEGNGDWRYPLLKLCNLIMKTLVCKFTSDLNSATTPISNATLPTASLAQTIHHTIPNFDILSSKAQCNGG